LKKNDWMRDFKKVVEEQTVKQDRSAQTTKQMVAQEFLNK